MRFMKKITLPQYKNYHFILLLLGLLVQGNVGRLEMIVFMIMYQKQYKVRERLFRKISEKLVYKYKSSIGAEIGNYQWKVLLLNISNFS